MSTDRRFTQTQERFAADDLQQMKLARRYQQWVYSLLEPYIGSRVFEVGSGIGTMTQPLLERAELVFGIEPNEACNGALLAAVGTHPRFVFRPWHIEACEIDLLLKQAFDTVVCVNVLEHIEDDVHALKLFGSVVAARAGCVLLLVPAVPAAYGPLDAALGHHRRYTRRGLTDVIERAGLTPRVVRYSNFIGLLGWYYNAKISRIAKHSDTQIQMFDTLVAPWASHLERIIHPPVGLSLIAVADSGPMARVPLRPMAQEPAAAAG
jgi:SAM-dependent methyltransferase